MKKLLTVVLISTALIACEPANASKWEHFDNRDAISMSDIDYTTIYFDTGRICEANSIYDYSGKHCSNWNVNPIQAGFYLTKCDQYAKDRRLCQTARNSVKGKKGS